MRYKPSSVVFQFVHDIYLSMDTNNKYHCADVLVIASVVKAVDIAIKHVNDGRSIEKY